MIIACDMDGMTLAFPEFFKEFFAAMQGKGNKVGILTAQPESAMEKQLRNLDGFGIHPDFFIAKPHDLKDMSNGLFKAKVCNELGVDLLFDDFESSDPQMLANFFCNNTKTLPFTSWAYDPDSTTDQV